MSDVYAQMQVVRTMLDRVKGADSLRHEAQLFSDMIDRAAQR